MFECLCYYVTMHQASAIQSMKHWAGWLHSAQWDVAYERWMSVWVSECVWVSMCVWAWGREWVSVCMSVSEWVCVCGFTCRAKLFMVSPATSLESYREERWRRERWSVKCAVKGCFVPATTKITNTPQSPYFIDNTCLPFPLSYTNTNTHTLKHKKTHTNTHTLCPTFTHKQARSDIFSLT